MSNSISEASRQRPVARYREYNNYVENRQLDKTVGTHSARCTDMFKYRTFIFKFNCVFLIFF